MVQALRYWHHYLLPYELVLYSDHEALHYINSQKKLNHRHGRWVEYLQEYSFVLKYKSRMENKTANALSRRVMLLSMISVEINGFERLKEEYESCPEFEEIYMTLKDENNRVVNGYHLQEGYLFRDNKLYILKTSVREFLIWKIHVGGLSGHFGRNKSIEEVECQFFWSSLKRNVAKLVGQCQTCQLAMHKK